MSRRYWQRRADSTSSSRIELRVTATERARYVAAAGEVGLSEWIRRALERALGDAPAG